MVTGPPFFLKQTKLIWLAVLSSNYRLYDFNDKISKIFRFLDIFILLVTFELLSHYPIIASANWLERDVHSHTDKIYREKLMF